MAIRAVVTCQSKKAGVLPDIMNMLGGLTSPWLKVCGLEESSSWIHAKSSTMALPMAKACRVGSGLGGGVRVRVAVAVRVRVRVKVGR